jgi:hypothetical protein
LKSDFVASCSNFVAHITPPLSRLANRKNIDIFREVNMALDERWDNQNKQTRLAVRWKKFGFTKYTSTLDHMT